MTALPPIPDEVYDAANEVVAYYEDAYRALNAAYPILAAHVLRWAARQFEPYGPDGRAAKRLYQLAEEVSRGE